MNTTLTIRAIGSALLLAVLSCAPGQQSSPPRASSPEPVTQPIAARFENGMAQVVPEYQDSSSWIREDLWVETDFDSDNDGRKDRVHVDVTRPLQTRTEGLRASVIYSASPYFAGTGSISGGMWDPVQELDENPTSREKLEKPAYQANRRRISNSLVPVWVPRGFAVVHSSQPGTGLSQGCPTVGDWPERGPMKFVVEWLNGRAKGFTTPTGNEEVSATGWSTGKVGMIGTSYEGTLPLAAAMTGVKGLEVVIPVAANTSYYHYYRSNGLVRSPGGYLGEDIDVLYDFVASGDTATRATCDALWKNGVFARGQDRRTGDFNEFWNVRDLVNYTGNIKAAVLLTHGLNDYNVMPEHSVRIYNDMKARGLPVSLYLHQGGHGGNPPMDMLNRWFSHYLYGVDNNVENDAPVWIVPNYNAPRPANAGRGGGARGGGAGTVAAVPYPSFPIPGSESVALYPSADGNRIGELTLARATGNAATTAKFTDDVAVSGSANASATASPNRLLYATPELSDTVHISGTPRITLRIAASKAAANLSVWTVMLPFDSAGVGSANHVGNIALGWADIRNHKSLVKGGNYSSLLPGEPLVPGRFYDVTFDLQPTDEFIPPGKRIALMIMSSDREFTLWPRAGTELTVDLAHSIIHLPVVGGAASLRKAGAR